MARYVSRTAISNNRIVSCLDDQVTYTWTPSGTRTTKRRTLSAVKFLDRFLQHMVPAGFARIRHYGLLSSAAAQQRESARTQIQATQNEATTERFRRSREAVLEPCRRATQAAVPRCPECDGPLLPVDVTYRRDPLGRDDELVFSKLAYHDTG